MLALLDFTSPHLSTLIGLWLFLAPERHERRLFYRAAAILLVDTVSHELVHLARAVRSITHLDGWPLQGVHGKLKGFWRRGPRKSVVSRKKGRLVVCSTRERCSKLFLHGTNEWESEDPR